MLVDYFEMCWHSNFSDRGRNHSRLMSAIHSIPDDPQPVEMTLIVESIVTERMGENERILLVSYLDIRSRRSHPVNLSFDQRAKS